MRPACKYLLTISGVIVGVLAVLILGLYLFLFANHATTPDTIARKVGLRLPAYEIVKAEDNMDRTVSAWSYYSYEIKFKEPLSEAYLHKVEKLQNCIHDADTYIVSKESPDNWSGKVSIDSAEDKALLEYEFWDSLF